MDRRWAVPQFNRPEYNNQHQLTHTLSLHGTPLDVPGRPDARLGFDPFVTLVPASIYRLRYIVSHLPAMLGAQR
jgi:hypothetical protein